MSFYDDAYHIEILKDFKEPCNYLMTILKNVINF